MDEKTIQNEVKWIKSRLISLLGYLDEKKKSELEEELKVILNVNEK